MPKKDTVRIGMPAVWTPRPMDPVAPERGSPPASARQKPPTALISLPPKPGIGWEKFMIDDKAGQRLDELPIIEQVNNAIQGCLGLSAQAIQFRADGADDIQVYAIIDSDTHTIWTYICPLFCRLQTAIMSCLRIMASMSIDEKRKVQFGEIEFTDGLLSGRPIIKFRAVFIPGTYSHPAQFIMSQV